MPATLDEVLVSDSTPPPVPRFPSQVEGTPDDPSIEPAPRSQELKLEAGQIVAKKYRLDKLIGSGGMGFVALATHLQLDQPVALKFLRKEAAARPDLVKRFAQEARAAAKIRGDHVARVSDVSELEDGTPFMVMEYLAGEDLSQRLTRTGKLGFAEAAGYVLEACEAIGEAHAMRIIHRDLKPSNMFLAQRPDGSEIVKVLDFGISKMLEDTASLTQTQASFGSIPYMAPEQMRNARHCDERTDIWALGVTFYELVTQNYPFPGTTAPEVISAVMEGALVPIERLRPDAPPLVRRVIGLCTQRDPSQRYIDISELGNDLAAIVGTEIARARAARITRLVAPGPEQLNVGSLDVDVVRRAALKEAAPAAAVVAAPRPVIGGTVPLGAGAFAVPQVATPVSAPSPTTGSAGAVVLSPAVPRAPENGQAPSRSGKTALLAVFATLGAAALLGGALWLRAPKATPKPDSPVLASAPIVSTSTAVAVVSAVAPTPPAQDVPPPSAPIAADAGARVSIPKGQGPLHTSPPAVATQAAPPAVPPVTPAAPAPKKTDPNGMIFK